MPVLRLAKECSGDWFRPCSDECLRQKGDDKSGMGDHGPKQWQDARYDCDGCGESIYHLYVVTDEEGRKVHVTSIYGGGRVCGTVRASRRYPGYWKCFGPTRRYS